MDNKNINNKKQQWNKPTLMDLQIKNTQSGSLYGTENNSISPGNS